MRLIGNPIEGVSMTTVTRLAILVLATMLLTVACGSDSSEPTETTQPTADVQPVDERIESLWIGPRLVDCVGVAPQKCMLVKRAADGQAEYFYDGIDGFTHQVGTSYVIRVAVAEIADPPADASSLSYRLVEVVGSTVVDSAAEIADTSWILSGFRDGDLFDRVPDEVTITLTFDGDRVNGSSGCNRYMGSFIATGDELSFGPLAGTKMMCRPEVMAQEDRFLQLLGAVESAEITFDGNLVLSPPSGLTLVFAPQ